MLSARRFQKRAQQAKLCSYCQYIITKVFLEHVKYTSYPHTFSNFKEKWKRPSKKPMIFSLKQYFGKPKIVSIMIDFFWLHANSCGNPPFVSIMTAQGHIHLFPPHSESFGEKRLKSILKRAFPHCSRSKVGPSNAICDKSSTTTKEKTAL